MVLLELNASLNLILRLNIFVFLNVSSFSVDELSSSNDLRRGSPISFKSLDEEFKTTMSGLKILLNEGNLARQKETVL